MIPLFDLEIAMLLGCGAGRVWLAEAAMVFSFGLLVAVGTLAVT